jgi:hypothetical protein
MITDIDEPKVYVTPTESARKVRKALRAAFPKAKISVTSHSNISVEWDDSITDVDGMRAALTKAGVARPDERYHGSPLTVDGHHLWFHCFNLAQREAARLDSERRRQEEAEAYQRAQTAIAEAIKTKRAARTETPWQKAPPPEPSVYQAFEQLREKAEAQVIAHEGDRRPSWAPPLILGGELASACLDLGWLTTEDKPIGRLWATFASPKQSKRYVREHISTLPLHGIACRGFQFFAGGERQGTLEILFEAQRLNDGTWQFGPSFYPHEYSSPRARKWEELIRERERVTHSLNQRISLKRRGPSKKLGSPRSHPRSRPSMPRTPRRRAVLRTAAPQTTHVRAGASPRARFHRRTRCTDAGRRATMGALLPLRQGVDRSIVARTRHRARLL